MKNVKTILIIEDDELVGAIYKKHFESAGFEVQIEMDGSEGYYRIFKTQPDAVLLDLLLPGMNGPAIIRKFRAQRKFADLPIIVFTNAFFGNIKRDAAYAGATQVFNKATASPQEIVAAVVNALNRDIDAPGAARETRFESRNEEPLLTIGAEPSFHSESYEPSATPLAGNPTQVGGGGKEALNDSVNAVKAQTSSSRVTEVQPPQKEGTQKELDNVIAFQLAVQEEFLQKSGPCIDNIRDILSALKVDEVGQPKVDLFLEMAQIAHMLGEHAAIVGLHYLAHLAAAYERLSRELYQCPSQFGIPTRRTLTKAIDMTAHLMACSSSCELKEFSQLNVLVVDDDTIARNRTTKTLDQAKLAYVTTSQSKTALELLQENKFDLVILDAKMDEMSGFDLCKALRKIDQYRYCPVIFISSRSDFHSKVVSLQSGGNDFIVKPFAPGELALKVLLYMINSQLVPAMIPKEPL